MKLDGLPSGPEDAHGTNKGHVEEQGNAQTHVVAIPGQSKKSQVDDRSNH